MLNQLSPAYLLASKRQANKSYAGIYWFNIPMAASLSGLFFRINDTFKPALSTVNLGPVGKGVTKN